MANLQITTTSGTTHQFTSNDSDPSMALDRLSEHAVNGGTFYRLPNGSLVAKAAVESIEPA